MKKQSIIQDSSEYINNRDWLIPSDLHTKEYLDDLKKLIVTCYLARHEGETSELITNQVEQFYISLAYYPTYLAKCEKHQREHMQRYGTNYAPVSTDKYPDYTYASRQSGVFSDFIQQCEHKFLVNTGKKYASPYGCNF